MKNYSPIAALLIALTITSPALGIVIGNITITNGKAVGSATAYVNRLIKTYLNVSGSTQLNQKVSTDYEGHPDDVSLSLDGKSYLFGYQLSRVVGQPGYLFVREEGNATPLSTLAVNEPPFPVDTYNIVFDAEQKTFSIQHSGK